MSKLMVVLCASAFAFGSVSALAGNDMKPLSKMETQDAKAARAAASTRVVGELQQRVLVVGQW